MFDLWPLFHVACLTGLMGRTPELGLRRDGRFRMLHGPEGLGVFGRIWNRGYVQPRVHLYFRFRLPLLGIILSAIVTGMG